MLELIILCLSVFANFGLAIVVLAKNPEGRVNRYFGFLTLSLVLWLTANYISTHPFFFDQLTWIRLAIACAAVMSMAMLLLTNIFPKGEPYHKKLAGIVITLGCIVTVVAAGPWVFTRLEVSGATVNPVPGLGMALFMPFIFATLMGSMYILFRRFRILKERFKEQVRYALIGVVVTFSLLALLNFVVIIIFHNTSFIVLSPLVGLIFTMSFAYGMIRHQLFDIRLAAIRSAAYILSLLTLAGLYYLMALGVSELIRRQDGEIISQSSLSVALALLLAFIFQPVKRFFDRLTNNIFFHDEYDTDDFLARLGEELSTATDLRNLLQRASNEIGDTMQAEYGFFYVRYGDGYHLNAGTQRHGQFEPEGALILDDYVEAQGPAAIVVDSLSETEPVYTLLKRHKVAVVLPLMHNGKALSYLLLGHRRSREFTKRDIRVLETIANELVIAIQNALSVQEVKDINATLQQRVNEATKELRATNKQLQRLDAAKDEFVSMASHQLRTPLTSVKGYISMVLEGDVGRISAQQRELLEEAFASSERMVHLIGDFLNVSRLKTGKFMIDQHATDLTKLIKQEVDSLQSTANAHNLKLVFRVPAYFPVLYVDEGKIRQVIMNFIDNAIYYSKEGTIITVELATIDGSAVLKVKDTGIGVPKAEQAHLFTKFFRATNARRQRPDGTGVGLFLAKKVIIAHGGSIVFESIEGEGSTFGFRLPVKRLSVPASDTNELNH